MNNDSSCYIIIYISLYLHLLCDEQNNATKTALHTTADASEGFALWNITFMSVFFLGGGDSQSLLKYHYLCFANDDSSL